MADVQFFGIGASGYPDPNVTYFQGTQRSTADVKLFGIDPGPSPTGALAKVVDYVVDPIDAPQVSFERGRIPTPTSSEPNNNVLVYYPTGPGSSAGAGRWTLPVALADISGVGIAPNLSLIAKPGVGPSGLCGSNLVFLTPTGLDDPTSSFTPSTNRSFPIVAYNDTDITVAGASGYAGATTTDRLYLAGADAQLRRTPVIEIILE